MIQTAPRVCTASIDRTVAARSTSVAIIAWRRFHRSANTPATVPSRTAGTVSAISDSPVAIVEPVRWNTK
jgi:hypothetical protein